MRKYPTAVERYEKARKDVQQATHDVQDAKDRLHNAMLVMEQYGKEMMDEAFKKASP